LPLPVTIGEKTIGEGAPVFIIGEVAGSHDGDLAAAKRLVEAAAASGVDAIKFQVLRADELVVGTHRKYQSFKKVEFPPDAWLEILSYTGKFDLPVLIDVFDLPSLELMTRPEVKGYKIHLTNLANPSMITAVAARGKPVFLATGGARVKEIRAAIDILKANGNSQIVLMHGYQGYPTKIEETNFRLMARLRELFHLPVGFLDHVDADTDMAMIVPLVAIAWGACAIEKHFTLDRSLKGRDYYSSLNPDELKDFVLKVRQIEKTGGTGSFGFSPEELKYRTEVMKNIVARVPIAAGKKITEDVLAFKRSEPGLPPSEAGKVVGKTARTDIGRDEVITWDKLQ
jgi:N,N'-diacetyllegionaminate synthase